LFKPFVRLLNTYQVKDCYLVTKRIQMILYSSLCFGPLS
jgi:hypothetical protein